MVNVVSSFSSPAPSASWSAGLVTPDEAPSSVVASVPSAVDGSPLASSLPPSVSAFVLLSCEPNPVKPLPLPLLLPLPKPLNENPLLLFSAVELSSALGDPNPKPTGFPILPLPLGGFPNPPKSGVAGGLPNPNPVADADPAAIPALALINNPVFLSGDVGAANGFVAPDAFPKKLEVVPVVGPPIAKGFLGASVTVLASSPSLLLPPDLPAAVFPNIDSANDESFFGGASNGFDASALNSGPLKTNPWKPDIGFEAVELELVVTVDVDEAAGTSGLLLGSGAGAGADVDPKVNEEGVPFAGVNPPVGAEAAGFVVVVDDRLPKPAKLVGGAGMDAGGVEEVVVALDEEPSGADGGACGFTPFALGAEEEGVDLAASSNSFCTDILCFLYCSNRSAMSMKGSLSTAFEIADTKEVFKPRIEV